MKTRSSLIHVLSLCSMVHLCADENLQYDKVVNDDVPQGSIEYHIQSKIGAGEEWNAVCEDGLFYNGSYMAVFDGATDKSGEKYKGKKGGRISRDIIHRVFTSIPPNKNKEYILDRINAEYKKFYSKYPDIDFKNDPVFRPSASLIWYNFNSRELVALGDCKARVDGIIYNDEEKLVDEICSELRSNIIKKLKLSDAEIKEKDIAREYMMPLLKAQSHYQNNINAIEPFQYWVIDGFNIPKDKIKSWTFEVNPKVIELSSDGYLNIPENASVKEYELLLKQLLKNDPLRIKTPATKGLKKGYISYDDRAVLIFKRK
ncbi:hypothetical protein HW115_02070 [Verrucomicrobiaceae bacterium N1E253]|uniref:PPM-type phosphatase domain-containing protein n=1 Tax=Oceaniferula marina TaxID=2748318 RepID=A0A851GF75_9BACT|nr:hypothetical protein [Oceaniferula marina]NWK54381.1 hypothetical protein [Oceaniferula marina]